MVGFGNSAVKALGRYNARVVIDGIAANIALIMVSDDVMYDPLMIGQLFTEQSHIVIKKTSENLEISSLKLFDNLNYKIKLFCKSQVRVSGLIDVYTDDCNFEGEIFFEGGLRFSGDTLYSVSSGLYHITRG